MKHTDYKDLTGRLNAITKEFNRTRLLLSSPSVDEDGNPGPINRGAIWLAIIRVDNDLSKLMDGLVDEFVTINQARADQGHPATEDVRVLIRAMDGFLLATSTPVPKIGIPYDKTRQRANEWMKMANTWFPGLIDHPTINKSTIQTSQTRKRKELVDLTIDRDKLAEFFKAGFKQPDKESKIVQFDYFYNDLNSGQYTPTDVGRIAFQVKHSRELLPKYNDLKFGPFLRLFFKACGVTVPKCITPSKYSKITDNTNMSAWLTIVLP